MKLKKIVFLIIMPLILLMLCISCENYTEGTTPSREAYIQAQTLGFTGTYEKWKKLIEGIDEGSITDVTNENGELIIILANGERINLGPLEDNIVPVYQGMTATSSTKNKPQEKKKRYLNMKIKDAIDDFLEIITTEKVEYYTTKGEKFNIVIHLYNPSSFEILSFTLNNQKYQSYQFKEGSTSTELVIEVEADKNPGIKEYTIDAIKYIDKTEIKDVQMDGQKTIKVGVKYDATPTASLISEELTLTSYEQVLEIQDPSNLITNKNSLFFFLYDGTNIVYKQALQIGINTIKYDDIQMGSKYEYMVIGVYDDCSGDGNKAVDLMSGELETPNGIVVTSQENFKRSTKINLASSSSDVLVQEVNLYDGDLKVQTIKDKMEVVFENLLSNHAYVAEVVYTYIYKGITRTSRFNIDVKTLICEEPTFEINTLIVDKKQVAYSVTLFDPDNVITNQAYRLLKDGQVVQIKTTPQNNFTDLLSNNTYEFEIIYNYNLNDGNDDHELKQQVTIKTKALNIPKIDITTTTTDNQIFLKEIITDFDETIKLIAPLELDDASVMVNKINEKEYLLANAKSNYTYALRISYKYDLNDGSGIIDETKEFTVTTSKQIPTLRFNPYNILQESVEYDLIVLDNNVTGRVNLVTLYEGLTFVKKLSTTTNKIDGLKPDTSYTIKVNYIYDFDDGFGSREINEEYTFKTLKQEPKYKLTFSNIDYTSFELCHDLDDVDGVLNFKKVEILLNSKLVQEITSLDDIIIQNLLADNTYKVVVKFERDLNNGMEEIAYTYYVTTNKYQKPELDITLDSTKTSILYNYKILDSNDIASFYEATLYYNGKKVDSEDVNQIFSNLLSNSLYTVRIALLNDYHDGKTPKLEYYNSSIKTKPLDDIELTINLIPDKKSISFTYNLTDLDLIATIIEVKLYYGYELVQTINELTINSFNNLYSNNNYRVIFVVKKDFRDGNSPIISEYAATTWTKSLTVPTVRLKCTVTRDSIYYEVDKDDVDNIVKLEYIQYRDLKTQHESTTLPIDDKQTITNLTPHTNYELGLYYSYNLNDGKSDITDVAWGLCTTLSAEINILKMEVLNTESPKTNEDINLKIYIENKYQVGFLSITINGKTYDCSVGPTDGINTWLVVLIPAPKVSGIMTITVEKFQYYLPDEFYEQKMIGNNTIDVEIMSRLDIIDIVLADGTTMDMNSRSNGYIMKVDNPYGYTITEIGIKDFSIGSAVSVYPIRINDNNWYVKEIHAYDYNVYIKWIKYVDSNNNETVRNYSDKITLNFSVNTTGSREVIKVYTPEDFMNMNESKIYELANDIDMKGYKWKPYFFTGYFDGKGHTISNLTYVHKDNWTVDAENYINATSIMILSEYSVFKNVYFKDIYFSTDTTAWYYSDIKLFNCKWTSDNLKYVIKNVLISGVIYVKSNGKVGDHLFTLPSSTTYVVDGMTINEQKYEYTNSVTSEELENGDFKQNVLKWNFTPEVFFESAGFMYRVIDDSYIVLLHYVGDGTTISVPSTINGLPVIGIMDSAFVDETKVKRVEIPSTILFIGTAILRGCYNIESIKMEDVDVKSINDLFGNVEYDNSYRAGDETNSRFYYIPIVLRKLELGSKSHTIEYAYENYGAFDGYKSLEVVVLEDDIEMLAYKMFNCCYNLREINMPQSLKYVPEYCLCNTKITQIKLGDATTKIGNSAFQDCKYLSEIRISPYTTEIGTNAFYECQSLTSLVLPETLTKLSDYAFANCINLRSINIPSKISIISDSLFMCCEKLSSIDIPDTVTAIQSQAFNCCTALTKIKIPSGVRIIETSTFTSCSQLREVILPDTVHTIEETAFALCYNLEKIEFSSNLRIIANNAFGTCSRLNPYIPSSVLVIEKRAFTDTGTVYCEATEKPDLWDNNWCTGEVAWGAHRQ